MTHDYSILLIFFIFVVYVVYLERRLTNMENNIARNQ